MARHHVDMSEVEGGIYTYYGAVNFNQANGWIVAEVMPHEAYADHVEPEDMSSKDRLQYYYYGPELGDCGFYKSVFECDPCTAGGEYGNRISTLGNTLTNTPVSFGMADMTLAPNPAQSEVTISGLLSELIQSDVTLKVFDATGRLQIDLSLIHISEPTRPY